MLSKVYKEVYDHPEHCCDLVEWIGSEQCPYFEREWQWCKMHDKRLKESYVPNKDPLESGTVYMKCQECKASLTKHDDQSDKLFLTEILNDLHRNGFVRQGKAETMLHDWGIELRKRSRTKHPASRLKQKFKELVGIEHW